MDNNRILSSAVYVIRKCIIVISACVIFGIISEYLSELENGTDFKSFSYNYKTYIEYSSAVTELMYNILLVVSSYRMQIWALKLEFDVDFAAFEKIIGYFLRFMLLIIMGIVPIFVFYWLLEFKNIYDNWLWSYMFVFISTIAFYAVCYISLGCLFVYLSAYLLGRDLTLFAASKVLFRNWRWLSKVFFLYSFSFVVLDNLIQISVAMLSGDLDGFGVFAERAGFNFDGIVPDGLALIFAYVYSMIFYMPEATLIVINTKLFRVVFLTDRVPEAEPEAVSLN